MLPGDFRNRFRSLAPLLGIVGFLGVADASTAAAKDRFVVVTDSHGIYHFGEGIENWLIQRKPKPEYEIVSSGGYMPTQWTPRVDAAGKAHSSQKRHTTTCGARYRTRASASVRECKAMTTPFLNEVWADQGPRKAGERRITVIAHGTNLPTSGREGLIASTVRLIQDAFAQSDECVWVGPPNMTRPGNTPKEVQFKYEVIEAAIQKVREKTGKTCGLIDSRQVSTYPAGGHDGVHYQWPLRGATKAQIAEGKIRAREWVQGVISGRGSMRGLEALTAEKNTAAVSPILEGDAFKNLRSGRRARVSRLRRAVVAI